MSTPKKPSLLGDLPTIQPQGFTDQQVRDLWEKQRRSDYVPGTPRYVQLGPNAAAWCLHPDDVTSGATRVPAYRPKRKGGRR